MTRTDPRIVRALLAGALLAAAAAAIVAITGGGTVDVAGLSIRSHDVRRPAIVAVVLALCAAAAGRGRLGAALDWWWMAIERHAVSLAALAAIAATVVGIAWGTFVAGGSDSYCYLNQAELLARGMVHDIDPLAADPAWPGNVWSFAAAGHVPARDVRGAYVPICPAGYPVLLAGARLLFGRTAMFWITPLLGGVLVFLTCIVGRRAGGPAAGLLAALLTATSPIVLYQIVQPMNDVPAATLWIGALTVASSTRWNARARAIAAGILTGAAVTIRPNLAPLAGIVGLGCALRPSGEPVLRRASSLLAFGLAVTPGIAFVMWIQAAMYGSPLSSGYGDLSALFQTSHIVPNLARYPRWLVLAHTPFVLAALAAPMISGGARRIEALWLLSFAALTFALYLPYVVFDAWWYLRFVLPAVPLLLALSAATLVELVRRWRAELRVVVFAAAAFALPLTFLSFAARHDVFLLKRHESRFRSAGEYASRLPPEAIVVTGHYTGSVRFYSGRRSVGWGDIDAGRLDDALQFLRDRGFTPYLMFADWEEPDFRRRFHSDRLGALRWPPIAEIDRQIRVYDPADFERHARGDEIRTETIGTGR